MCPAVVTQLWVSPRCPQGGWGSRARGELSLAQGCRAEKGSGAGPCAPAQPSAPRAAGTWEPGPQAGLRAGSWAGLADPALPCPVHLQGERGALVQGGVQGGEGVWSEWGFGDGVLEEKWFWRGKGGFGGGEGF